MDTALPVLVQTVLQQQSHHAIVSVAVTTLIRFFNSSAQDNCVWKPLPTPLKSPACFGNASFPASPSCTLTYQVRLQLTLMLLHGQREVLDFLDLGGGEVCANTIAEFLQE